jgi:hypothetical protein
MQILRLKCSGMSLWSDLLLIGDLSPVHTFNDIEGILQKQISNATAGEKTTNPKPWTLN